MMSRRAKDTKANVYFSGLFVKKKQKTKTSGCYIV